MIDSEFFRGQLAGLTQAPEAMFLTKPPAQTHLGIHTVVPIESELMLLQVAMQRELQ